MACPELVPLIQSGDTHGHDLHEAAKTYAAPLKLAGVDTVILGCTHYPLIRQMLQRIFGRDVTLITSAEEIAREVAETIARRGVGNEPAREGDYRFLCTGDPAAFREVAGRFLQLPLTGVERVDAAHPAGRGVSRADGRAADELRPVEIELDFIPSASGSALFRDRLDPAHLHRDGGGVGAAVDARPRHRLGHVGVRHAAGLDVGAEIARREPRPRRRAHGRDPAPGGAVAAVGGRLQGARRAHGRGSTATSSRPTAAPAARPSAAATWRCTWRSRGSSGGGCSTACPCATRWPPSRWGSSTPSRCSTCPTPRTAAPRST